MKKARLYFIAATCISSFSILGISDDSFLFGQETTVAETKSNAKQLLDSIRQSMLTGAREEAAKAAVKLKALSRDELSTTERELWLRLSREAAVRLGDRETLESLRLETDSFETQLIYRVLLASGQLEKGELAAARRTLDEIGDIDVLNEREKRRVFAIRARLAQLQGDTVQERLQVESIIDHLDRWPTADCQSCHNAPANPKAITSLPIQRFWFGERYVELMKKQNDAEAIKVTSEKELAADSTNDRAKIRLAYAYRALGNEAKAKQLFESIQWVEKEGRESLKPRMMTTFP